MYDDKCSAVTTYVTNHQLLRSLAYAAMWELYITCQSLRPNLWRVWLVETQQGMQGCTSSGTSGRPNLLDVPSVMSRWLYATWWDYEFNKRTIRSTIRDWSGCSGRVSRRSFATRRDRQFLEHHPPTCGQHLYARNTILGYKQKLEPKTMLVSYRTQLTRIDDTHSQMFRRKACTIMNSTQEGRSPCSCPTSKTCSDNHNTTVIDILILILINSENWPHPIGHPSISTPQHQTTTIPNKCGPITHSVTGAQTPAV